MKLRSYASPSSRWLSTSLLGLALAGCIGTALAQQAPGRGGPSGPAVRVTAPVVLAGATVEVAGSGFKPGQKITLSAGGAALNAQPYVADGEGKFAGTLVVPADAGLGAYPVTVAADGTAEGLSPLQLKISKQVPLSGQGGFEVVSRKLVQGLYQSAYSAKGNAVFVTSAVGRPPVSQSALLKVDPRSLDILAQVAPQPAPVQPREGDGEDGPAAGGRQGAREPGVYAVYGVAVDDAHGNVWVTNTRQNTVAVYRQSDLKLVKQFPVGAVPHSRDVVVDAARGRAYVSAVGEDYIAVFDTRKLAPLANIPVASATAGGTFAPVSLSLDAATGKVYAVSLRSAEAAVIDGPTGKVDKVIPLQGTQGAIGVAYDSAAHHLLAVSQSSDNLLIVDVASGRVLHDVYVGAGALGVAYDPVHRLAYVASRAAGTVTVVDAQGRIVANLDGGTYPNHVAADGKGDVFLINKSRGEDDPQGDRITRITPRAQ
ncbi:YncE family protein [Xanthomonas massiliensis]|uniref:YncE family protein n=1 Tax=Xanthomonas massiliensis TaxID=1720302 RepID=UPI0008266158|nr:YncE family protein [Xanthomonas massiliensis]